METYTPKLRFFKLIRRCERSQAQKIYKAKLYFAKNYFCWRSSAPFQQKIKQPNQNG